MTEGTPRKSSLEQKEHEKTIAWEEYVKVVENIEANFGGIEAAAWEAKTHVENVLKEVMRARERAFNKEALPTLIKYNEISRQVDAERRAQEGIS